MKYLDWKAQHRADEAGRTLTHYINRIFAKNGLQWDSDNAAEITDLIDDIVTAAVLEALARVAKSKEAA